ncbi:MAG: hypothetical protein KatS3mg002_0570 [Candidatus Woesearchaeota archaeon]|nr:MAG: hypothetical protein KatS3mg002_0570 [Candidatus Woesearchaeota archaeon]
MNTTDEIKKTKEYSIKDGSAWSVMYGFGEQYIVPFALKIGATASQIGVLNSVPTFIGAIFQIIGAKLAYKYKSRKKIVTNFVLIQAMIMLPLFLIPFLTKSMFILTVLFTLYNILANIVGPAWSSWISDVVPEEERASYFSKRNKYVVASTMISVLTAGLILHYYEQTNVWIGFGILFSISFLGRLVSWYYLKKQFEPKTIYVPEDESFLSFIKRTPGTNFGNFILFRSFMAFAVMIAGPFFSVFLLKDLGFNYIQYTILVLAPMASKVFTISYWGRYSDKFGTRNILIITGAWIALIPLQWFLASFFIQSNMLLFYALIIIELMSGFAWGGFELTTFNYILETVSPEKRAIGFAYFNSIFGVSVIIGGLTGVFLVRNLPEMFSISTLMMIFIISTIARSLVLIIFSKNIKEVKVSRRINEKKLFFELIFARPFNNALQNTATSFLNTERDVKKIINKTENIIKEFAYPIINIIDKQLESAEKIRNIIEPDIIKKHKKKLYKDLTESKLNKKLSKHYMKKRRIKKIKKNKKSQ